MHRKLGFIWKTQSEDLHTASDRRYPYPPRQPQGGCAQRKALESQLFFVQFKDVFISTFQRPDLR